MFAGFTDGARRVVVLAQEEARMLQHSYLGTEHLLLGLIHEGEGVGARTLEALGISLDGVRRQVEEVIGQGQTAPEGHIPLTPRAKKVLELALREALRLGHEHIGTEHLLLGLLSQGEGVGAQILGRMGATIEQVRAAVLDAIDSGAGEGWEPLAEETSVPVRRGASPGEGHPGPPPRCPHCGWSIRDGLGYRTVDATAEGGDEIRKVNVSFCLRCGTAISSSTP